MQSSSSFTVEKCYNSSNLSLREAIVSELAALQSDLSKTKQGPHLLRKLDVEGYTINAFYFMDMILICFLRHMSWGCMFHLDFIDFSFY